MSPLGVVFGVVDKMGLQHVAMAGFSFRPRIGNPDHAKLLESGSGCALHAGQP